ETSATSAYRPTRRSSTSVEPSTGRAAAGSLTMGASVPSKSTTTAEAPGRERKGVSAASRSLTRRKLPPGPRPPARASAAGQVGAEKHDELGALGLERRRVGHRLDGPLRCPDG